MAARNQASSILATEASRPSGTDSVRDRPHSSGRVSPVSIIPSIDGNSRASTQSIRDQQAPDPAILESAQGETRHTNVQDGCEIAKKFEEPFYLRPSFLLGNAILCILMITALEVMNLYSQRNNGLSTVSESHYYLWKYGPTSGGS